MIDRIIWAEFFRDDVIQVDEDTGRRYVPGSRYSDQDERYIPHPIYLDKLINTQEEAWVFINSFRQSLRKHICQLGMAMGELNEERNYKVELTGVELALLRTQQKLTYAKYRTNLTLDVEVSSNWGDWWFINREYREGTFLPHSWLGRYYALLFDTRLVAELRSLDSTIVELESNLKWWE